MLSKKKIRLYPAPSRQQETADHDLQDLPPDLSAPAPRPPRSKWPGIAVGATLAMVLSTATFMILAPRVVYHSRGLIRVICSDPSQAREALAGHLLGLESRQPAWSTAKTTPATDQTDRNAARPGWATLADKYSVVCRASINPAGVILEITGPVNHSRNLAAIQQGYIAQFNAYQKQALDDVGPQQDQLLQRKGQLQSQLSHVSRQMDLLLEQFNTSELTDAIGRQISGLEALQQTGLSHRDDLNRLASDLQAVSAELADPAATIGPQTLLKACLADKRFAADFRELKYRHKAYINNLQGQMGGLLRQLVRLRGHLGKVSAAIARQLSLDLPEALADDLLQLNTACKLHETELASFEQRWLKHSDQVLKILDDPLDADIDAAQSILGQLQVQFDQRSGQLAQQLGQLRTKLTQPPGTTSPGSLASLTVRAVAGSALTAELEAGLRRYDRLKWYLQRACGQDNFELLTLGRVVRALQWRARARREQIHKYLRQQAQKLARQEAQIKLARLQTEYRDLTQVVLGHTDKILTSQQGVLELYRAYPKWCTLNDQARQKRSQLDLINGQISSLSQGQTLAPETLAADAIESRVTDRAVVQPILRWALALLACVGGYALGLFGTRLILPA